METGISPEQIAQLKETWRKWTSDPIRYRFLVAAAIALLGYYSLVGPLAARVESAKAALERADAQAKAAKAVLSMQAQTKLYEPRLTEGKDASNFEEYVIGVARDVGLNVYSLTTRKLTPMGPYHAAALLVEAEGALPQIVDFIDRLERGERLARLDALRFTRKGDTMGLNCNVLGLQRRPEASPGRPEPAEAPAERATEAAAPGEEEADG